MSLFVQFGLGGAPRLVAHSGVSVLFLALAGLALLTLPFVRSRPCAVAIHFALATTDPAGAQYVVSFTLACDAAGDAPSARHDIGAGQRTAVARRARHLPLFALPCCSAPSLGVSPLPCLLAYAVVDTSGRSAIWSSFVFKLGLATGTLVAALIGFGNVRVADHLRFHRRSRGDAGAVPSATWEEA